MGMNTTPTTSTVSTESLELVSTQYGKVVEEWGHSFREIPVD
jgi:hypothetical protein